MEFRFNKKEIVPTNDFGDVSELFRKSLKYEIALRFQKKGENWDNNTYTFLFDTGAFISFAPESILNLIQIPIIFEGFVRGVSPKEECRIKVKMGKVSFRILDDFGSETPEIQTWFAFHQYKGSFLFGMKDAIEKIKFIHDPIQNQIIFTL